MNRPSPRATSRALVLMIAVAAALATLVAIAPGGNAAPTKVLTNNVVFQDSTGEDAAGPDIVSVTVANDDQGNITFTLSIPNRATLTGDMLIQIFVDSDSNPATGNAELLGADYVLELHALDGPARVGLFRWDGTNFTGNGVPQSSLVFSYANGATIKVSAAELGATKRFNFLVFAISGLVVTPTGDLDDTNAHFDLAPDPGHGMYAYEVKITPPTIVVKSFGTRPLKPKSGKAFTVFMGFARSDAGAPVGTETVACKATLGGKALRPTSTGVANGRATCTWSIPKTAKGKAFRASITVHSEQLTATRSVAAKVG